MAHRETDDVGMGQTGIDGVRWKLQSAREHHELLYGLVHGFLESPLYRISSENDRQGRLVARITHVEPVPAGVALLVGECTYQLRSALDYLMFLCAKPCNEREEQQVQFPIVSKRSLWKGTSYRMPGVPPGLRTVTESLQPYHRRKWPDTRLLWQLRQLNDWDKHRLLASSVAMVQGSKLNLEVKGVTTVLSEESIRGPLEEGAVFARLELGYGERGDEVNVHPELALFVQFDKGMPKGVRGELVLGTIADIGTFIQDEVVPRFEPFVP